MWTATRGQPGADMKAVVQAGTTRKSGAKLRYNLRQYFVVITVGVSSFYGGWLAKDALEHRVYVSPSESIPTTRGGGGHVVVTVNVPNAAGFVSGESVGLMYQQSDESVSTATCGLTVWETDSKSISLLVSEDAKDYLLDLLTQPNCRLVKCPD